MVPQCGYCIPGVIMAAAALIDRNDSPTDAQIDRHHQHLPLRHLAAARVDPPRGSDQGRREQVSSAPPPGIAPEDAARECRRCGLSVPRPAKGRTR